MKVLFVCQRNNGRSQLAKALFNLRAGSNDAASAGLTVDVPGQTLAERAQTEGSDVGKVIEVMKELGVDVRGYERTPFDEQMIKDYDKVVFILEQTPKLSPNSDRTKIETWHISDPKQKDLDGVRQTREEIDLRVARLVRQKKH